MSISRVQENMSADDKIVAFDFQYLYFLYTLFNLKINESAGFEVEDDVHINHSNGSKTLIQVKHTVNNGRISKKDSDLWKTVWSWLKIIDVAGTEEESKKFIVNTEFVLLTNKKDVNNSTIAKINDFKNSNCTINELLEFIAQLKRKNGESEVDRKINDILSHSQNLLSSFFSKVSFSTKFDELEKKILINMEEKHYSEHLRQPILDNVYSSIRKRLADTVKAKDHLTITQIEFSTLINSFNYFRSGKVSVYDPFVHEDIPNPNSTMIFIRQLQDIDHLSLNDDQDKEYVMDLFYNKLFYETNSKRWIQDSEVTEEEVYEIESVARSEWNKQFRRFYRRTSTGQENEEEILEIARQLFEKIEDTKIDFSIEVSSQERLGNGLFLNLSDKPVIGWHMNWKEKYSSE